MSYFLVTSILVIYVEQPSVIASFHAMKMAYLSILKIVHLETGKGRLRNKKKYLER